MKHRKEKMANDSKCQYLLTSHSNLLLRILIWCQHHRFSPTVVYYDWLGACICELPVLLQMSCHSVVLHWQCPAVKPEIPIEKALLGMTF